MITRRQLAIVRAALQFFDEEFSPHASDVAECYFDPPLDPPLEPSEVGELRKTLEGCQLRYAVCDAQCFELLGGMLAEDIKSLDAVLTMPSHAIVTVILLTSA